MHVADGFLPLQVVAIGLAAGAVITAATLPALQKASPPRVAMVTAAFFAGSLLSFPFYGTSVHLSLVGLAGVVLGRAAFPSILVALALQFFLFGHGGYTTLGVNAVTMGAGALTAATVFHAGKQRTWLKGGVAAGLGMTVSLLLYGAALLSAEQALRKVAVACLVVHAPVLLIEIVLTAGVVRFLVRVQPDLLETA